MWKSQPTEALESYEGKINGWRNFFSSGLKKIVECPLKGSKLESDLAQKTTSKGIEGWKP